MHPIRVVISSNRRGLESEIERLRAAAEQVRKEEGCLEFDYFRDVDFPENFAQLELWESQEAFDRHWQNWTADDLFDSPRNLVSPNHAGNAPYPRRHGENGIEFYRHAPFEIDGAGAFIAVDRSERIESIRWPSHGRVRIVIQACNEPDVDATMRDYSAETRAQQGCVEFAFLRSLEHPEHNLHLELWEGPPAIYDLHFHSRAIHNIWGIGVDRPPAISRDRHYGSNGLEFYRQCYYTPVDDTWEPEDPQARMNTIRWTF